jgi:hypothetical protein
MSTRDEDVRPAVGQASWGFGLPPMFGNPVWLPLRPFQIVTKPSASELGREDSASSAAVFLLSFGVETASHLVTNAWKACCELYLQSQLARHDKLHSFSLEGEKLFAVNHFKDTVVCSWSNQHIFAVRKAEFVGQAEAFVEQVLAALSADRAEQFVRLGASMIREDTRFARLVQPELA